MHGSFPSYASLVLSGAPTPTVCLFNACCILIIPAQAQLHPYRASYCMLRRLPQFIQKFVTFVAIISAELRFGPTNTLIQPPRMAARITTAKPCSGQPNPPKYCLQTRNCYHSTLWQFQNRAMLSYCVPQNLSHLIVTIFSNLCHFALGSFRP